MINFTAPKPHPSTREERGLELYRTRGHEIRQFGTGLYRVPSCSGEGFYTVNYLDEWCTCPDHSHHPETNCKHILAVGVLVAKRRRQRPHACNSGWVTIGQIALDPETGEETEEYALYLCRRCAEAAR